MYRVREQDLPFKGSSYNFVGADNGGEGRGRWAVNGEEFEAGAGDILVIKAGEIHSFQCIGDEPLVQLDVHLSPRFIQENLS
jgi:gentisate 1,2-dioxygenase